MLTALTLHRPRQNTLLTPSHHPRCRDVRLETAAERHRARGVILKNGARLAADAVVANHDLPYVYRDLLPKDGKARRLGRKRNSCSVISFFWGVDRPVKTLPDHTLFLADDYRENFESIDRGLGLPENPSLYVHTPARLAQLGITELERHLKFEVNYTTLSWRKRYNLVRGATHGLAHTLTQLGFLRPRNRHPRYENLYFAGASTHPGTGSHGPRVRPPVGDPVN